jgi:hypothetical protein
MEMGRGFLSGLTPRSFPQRLRLKLRRGAGRFRESLDGLSAPVLEADFDEYRRQCAWTAWKYAMQEAGLPLPSSGQARCFCGATIDIAVTDRHINEAHMMDLQLARTTSIVALSGPIS